MRILTYYLLRMLIGPFVFALTVLTSLLLINTVARRLEDLVGKGLPWGVMGEFLLLSIPHILALTLPMGVLVAVLHSFSQLTADNEVTALKASGVNLLRLLLPVLLAASMMTVFMVWFNDSLLPESNHRLKNLMTDLARKAPTLQLKEQVINDIQTGDLRSRYYLQSATIDPATNGLRDVVIYDLSNNSRTRTVYAERGEMAFNRERTDLFLTLHSGWIHEIDNNTPERFTRVFFNDYFLRIRGIGNKLERTGDEYRSDREMSLAMLQNEVDRARTELGGIRKESAEQSKKMLTKALKNEKPVVLPPSAGGAVLRPLNEVQSSDGTPQPGDELSRQAALEARVLKSRAEGVQDRMNQYQGEWHKKFSIPFACLVFVLIGAPVAVRFPRGGVGMVIAISLAVFGIYYVSLIGGESLSDKGLVPPFWGMWAANILFFVVSLWGVVRLGHETSTQRGGGWDDLMYTIRSFFSRSPSRRRS